MLMLVLVQLALLPGSWRAPGAGRARRSLRFARGRPAAACAVMLRLVAVCATPASSREAPRPPALRPPAPLPRPPLPTRPPAARQDVDFSVTGREDAARYDLDVGQRVLVSCDPLDMMAFAYDEIDGTAAVA